MVAINGFYWENDPPELSENNGANVDEGDTVYINHTLLAATDVESSNEELIFLIDPDYRGELPAHGTLMMESEMVASLDSITLDNLINNLIYYIQDGSETTVDSIRFTIYDSDSVKCHINDDSVFYFMLNVTPVDDPPTLEVKTGGTVTEGEILTLEETVLRKVVKE